MKKWLRRAGMAALVVALLLAALFEVSTHVMRGWLRGEAFYDGRPTSYWRPRCDEWIGRFDEEFSFEIATWMIPFEFSEEPGARRYVPNELMQGDRNIIGGWPKQTSWTRLRDSFRSKADLERDKEFSFAPGILLGTPDTQPVLEELAREEKYRPLAKIALGRVERIKGFYAEFKKEKAASR